MTKAPPRANIPMPTETGSPINIAPVAPGSPICAKACEANVEWRAMVKYPITPAAKAMHNPARNALAMNGAVSVDIQSGSNANAVWLMRVASFRCAGGIARPLWDRVRRRLRS